MKKVLTILTMLFVVLTLHAEKLIYVIEINGDINSKSWVIVREGVEKANNEKAETILFHINTYGGEVSFADSIRTLILNTEVPTIAFIDNNAASAGALISIACDKIYMRKGASIGAATVVNGVDGQAMPDKYQSYMRSTMRSTAEAHGRDSLGNWNRDPLIAEAMVDSRTVVEGVIDSTRTLTFTTTEAIKYNYCQGEAESIEEALTAAGEKVDDCKIETFKPSAMTKLEGVLTNTALQSILIMLIIGGIYFELQQPGIGFPTVIAVGAAVLYFAPLIMNGLAAYWEIGIFILGIILIILEIFVVPGFGITGISGIALVVAGLVLSMLGNVEFDFTPVNSKQVAHALFTTALGILLSVIAVIYITSKVGTGIFARLALTAAQDKRDGFVGVDTQEENLVGSVGTAATDLRPSGKVDIDGKRYDAITLKGNYIAKGSNVEVVRFETGQLYVK